MRYYLGLHFIFILLLFVFSSVAAEKRVMSNGAILITEEDHSRDIVAVLTYVDGGARTETPELSGLSHYFEHLIFRGGTSMQAELETRKKFLALGKFYGYTFEDGTCYYIVVPTKNLREAMERYSDVLLNLKLTEEKVETERGIVLEEFSQSYFDVPSGMAYYYLYRTAFTVHPYGQTVIGDSAVVRSATLDIFQRFYNERYTPDNFVIAAVGDFDTDELTAEIERTFGGRASGNLDLELDKVEPPQKEFRWVNHRMPINTVHFALGFHIPAFSALEFPALEVLNQALTASENSRLNMELVRERELFTYLSSWVDRTKDPGLWMIYGNLSPENVDRAFLALFTALGEAAERGLTFSELESAKKELVREYKSSRESFFKRSESLCFYELTSSLALEGLYEQRITGLDAGYAARQARRIIRPQNATLSIVIPENMALGDPAVWVKPMRVSPSVSKTEKSEKAGVQEIRLANGAILLLSPNESAQTAAMEILVKGGLWVEPEGQEGIADFLCRLLTRGTLDLEGREFSRLTGDLGVQITAEADWDFCRLSMQSTLDVFIQGLELAILAFTRPGLREEDVENVRREIIADIGSVQDRTYDFTRQEFDQILYRKNPYGRPVNGYEAAVEKISVEDLRGFHKSNFCGENIIVSVAGNFNPSAAASLLTELMGEIKRGGKARITPQMEAFPKEPLIKVIPKERAQTTYNLGWTAPPAGHKDFLPMSIARNMLSKRMFFRFVYEEGICYRMWTRYSENIGPGKFWFETGISPDNYAFSRDEVLKEFAGFLREPMTEEMLRDAVEESIQRMKIETETPSDRAFSLAKYYILEFGADYVDNYEDKISMISIKDVMKAVKKYLRKDKYTLLVVGKTEDK